MKINQIPTQLSNQYGLTGNRPIILGVSGGADSLCLLDLMVKTGLPLVVAHFDHQLRAESGADAEKVKTLAQKYGLKFCLGNGKVSEYAQINKLSIEEAARYCRYRFLFDIAGENQAEAVAVAHTADDQVETVLMHLMRGTGLSGLKGMTSRSILPEWNARIPLIRPLLDIWKEEIQAYCLSNQLEPLIDQTNQDVTYFRNRLRHQLIPYLTEYNPQIKMGVWRMAQSLEGDYEVLQNVILETWNNLIIKMSKNGVVLSHPKIKQLPVGLQRNMVRKAILAQRPYLRDIDFDTVEKVLTFIQSPSRSKQMDLVDGIAISIIGDHLIFGSPAAGIEIEDFPSLVDPESRPCPQNGEISLDHGWKLIFTTFSTRCALDMINKRQEHAWLDMEQMPHPLTIRGRKVGDRFSPMGMDGHNIKISDFFINQHLPLVIRNKYPLICSGDEIVWVPGMRLGEKGKVSSKTCILCHIQLVKNG